VAEKSKAELLQGLSHLIYEIQTMVRSAVRYQDEVEGDGEGDDVVRLACLESSLLHARNLIEFLAVPNRGKTKYIRPDDFAPDKEWDYSEQSDMPPLLGPLNDHLTHLGWKRAEPRTEQATGGIIRRVLRACEAFRDHLESSSFFGDSALRDALSDARELTERRLVGKPWSDSSPFTTTTTVVSVVATDPLDLL
jgi:hypothetical protein